MIELSLSSLSLRFCMAAHCVAASAAAQLGRPIRGNDLPERRAASSHLHSELTIHMVLPVFEFIYLAQNMVICPLE